MAEAVDDAGRRIDPLEDRPEALAADLRAHAALRGALVRFYEEIARASGSDDPGILGRLRTQPVYHMAEFFFLLRAYGLERAEQLREIVRLHNAQIAALQADKERRDLFGFGGTRLKKALFDEASENKLVVNYEHMGGFDQSDLSRLLIEVMAPETCRSTVVDLEKAGLLKRSTGVYNAVVVSSTGRIETAFARHVRFLREGVEAR